MSSFMMPQPRPLMRSRRIKRRAGATIVKGRKKVKRKRKGNMNRKN
jgi:hypothetical protein